MELVQTVESVQPLSRSLRDLNILHVQATLEYVRSYRSRNGGESRRGFDPTALIEFAWCVGHVVSADGLREVEQARCSVYL